MSNPESPIGSQHRVEGSRRSRSKAYRSEIERLGPFEEVARLVIARRMESDMTQAELAERMGTTASVISRIESGQHPTSVKTLKRVAEAFGTNLVVGFSDGVRESDASRDLATVA